MNGFEIVNMNFEINGLVTGISKPIISKKDGFRRIMSEKYAKISPQICFKRL